MRTLSFAIACCLLPLCAAAQNRGFVAKNELVVVPINKTDVEVIEARGSGARNMWCAAADYILKTGQTQPHQRFYVKTPRGPSQTRPGHIGVVFTTNPAGLDVTRAYSVSVRKPGLSLPVEHAYRFCFERIIERQR